MLGLAGLLLFGAVHAVAIVPIWSRLPRGLLLATAIGLALAWAYHGYVTSGARPATLATGVGFGALCWVACLPAMTFGFGMRVMAIREIPWWVDPATTCLAAVGGAILLWRRTHRRSGTVAGALATGLMFLLNGGPFPIADLARPIGLILGFGVIDMVGGLVLAFTYSQAVQTRMAGTRLDHAP